MSWYACTAPKCESILNDSKSLHIRPSITDLGGGFQVRRLLPSEQCKSVGPFVFFDEMGPAVYEAGAGFDVRPHPHIGIATVSKKR